MPRGEADPAGEPSVTMGAYLNAMVALSLEFGILEPVPTGGGHDDDRKGWIPARIRLADYPQVKQLASQVHGTDALTPSEALGIYVRHWRHLDLQAMDARERNLVEALRMAFLIRNALPGNSVNRPWLDVRAFVTALERSVTEAQPGVLEFRASEGLLAPRDWLPTSRGR